MNPYTISGIVAGLILGFLLGRAWAEYFRAVAVGRTARMDRKLYRGGTFAWYVGALIIVGVAIAYGTYVPT